MENTTTEVWDLYTADREKTGKTMVRGMGCPDGYYRVVIHVCIFNNRGEMLIQQRQPFKKGWSNLWDFTVGGHVLAGESAREAAEREVKEEIGYTLSLENTRPAFTLSFETGFDDIYLVRRDIDIADLKLQYEEVQAVEWADQEEILRRIDNATFIPYHKALVELLFHLKDCRSAHTRGDK